jgi:hypothetical protein
MADTQTQTSSSNPQPNISKAIGVLGLLIGMAIVPPIFSRIFAVGALESNESNGLWVFSIGFILLSLALFKWGTARTEKVGLVFFSVIILISIELTARFSYNVLAPESTKQRLALAAEKTADEFMAYKGHPFVVFTGVEGVSLVGNQQNETAAKFNKQGFIGDDFVMGKSPDVVRVATLGGSTTARGYPKKMNSYLNASSSTEFEVLNFGMSFWTTAHSMVNFTLNVVDYQPDYVVVHHAWNDSKPRNVAAEDFRNDYSHVLTYFHEPEIPDKWPIKVSLIYRYFRFFHSLLPTWAYLENATTLEKPKPTGALYSNTRELEPYERNLRTIIDLAIMREMRVLLVTQPHSHDESILYYFAAEHIDQCNEIARGLAQEYGDQVAFLDLDSAMSGKMDSVFVDVGHMNPEGMQVKAELIGQAILNDIELQVLTTTNNDGDSPSSP